ncbi:MAG: hypothetical protein Q9160_005447 [Pyrenula sp. 1 TL-2023]
MLASLLHPSRTFKKARQRDYSPFSSPFTSASSPVATRRGAANERRRPAADFDDDISDDDGYDDDESEELEDEGPEEGFEAPEDDEDENEDDDEDGLGDATPLLPIFSAAHLDSLPTYNLTHTIRLLIIARCETTLSWDQLRSPQVSQFLIRPIQQEILTSHFSRATQYALMANCLQFGKEIAMNPGNSGTSRTRAMIAELLAIRLLKEFSTRELIDALSYDFYPLQGQSPPTTTNPTVRPNWDPNARPKAQPRAARISCLEVALRAQAKRFLAHPVVVHQLEAIWSGTIVFHSAADNLHRVPKIVIPNQTRGYGTLNGQPTALQASPTKLQPAKQRDHHEDVEIANRRTVTLYDPRDASLFKLSRLRVPRYRNILSTFSFAVLLGLFLAVLIERSMVITSLEVTFWIWSAGYMLDEIVGFNEQGFSLYLASFWNTFDLGILMILIVHFCLRIYGITRPAAESHHLANLAYDVLAADAILLFPRLFSVLDHIRYFSQLLVAFRMMAADFMAILILILITCSGFFVALTLSFGNDSIDDPNSVAYVLFQILMGFTPAAWDRWGGYNTLGKTIMTIFLCICHFLVVTILITVLTNSFMAIVQNANEEHQFLFAVNTISMVKSDALFSYVAPTNILGWAMTPLRYFIPFRRYVKVNRTAIKITHFPILFSIYLYERMVLNSDMIDSTDLVEPRGRSPGQSKPNGLQLFHPQSRTLREPSVATYHKDKALEEVFRRPFTESFRGTQRSQDRRQTSNAVSTWMKTMGDSGVLSPPQEQDRGVVDRLETRRLANRRSQLLRRGRDYTEANRSVASDPEDFMSNTDFLIPPKAMRNEKAVTPSRIEEQTDADDELVTNDNDEDDKMTLDMNGRIADPPAGLPDVYVQTDYFSPQKPLAQPRGPLSRPKSPRAEMSTSASSAGRARIRFPTLADRPKSRRQSPSRPSPKGKRPMHNRHTSTQTILYNPVEDVQENGSIPSSLSSNSRRRSALQSRKTSTSGGHGRDPDSLAMASNSKPISANALGRRTPKKTTAPNGLSRARPIMPPKGNPAFMSAPNLAGLLMLDQNKPNRRGADVPHRRSSLAMDIGSDIGDNKAIGGGYGIGNIGGIPASFGTQMAYATGGLRIPGPNDDDEDRQTMLGKLVLARMNTLEEGLRDVVNEMRGHFREGGSGGGSGGGSHGPSRGAHALAHVQVQTIKKAKGTEKGKDKTKDILKLNGASRGKKRSIGGGDGGKSTRPASDEEDWIDEDGPEVRGGHKGSSI